MSYTRKEWASAFLAAIGNTSPDPYILDYVIAWTQFESQPGEAQYNLLNTTEPDPKWGGFIGSNIQGPARKAGVKDFPSFADGVGANAEVLMQTGQFSYPELLHALQHNNDIALKAPDQGIMHELGLWGTGRASDIANLAGRPDSLLSDQPFPGEGPTGPPQPVGTPSVTPPVVEPPSKIVKIGKGEDFRLILIGDRWTVVLKHSSEASLKAKGYLG